jgi:hypothetical protein
MTTTTPVVSVFDGRDCLGFILSKGKSGFLAITVDDRDLGLFDSQREAADALTVATTKPAAIAPSK